MSRYRPNPPPIRNGVSPSCVVLPAGNWPTVLDFLQQRFAAVPRTQWTQRMDTGEVIDSEGQAVPSAAAFTSGRRLYYYRTVEQEAPIPFEAEVIHQDEHLLVVDKPHFLPVIPSGKYVRETLLVRLKDRLGLPGLSPIHRIDRDTAGLVLFSVNPASRNAYQALFRQRAVEKTYECIARWNPDLPWPVRRESRIGPADHFMQQTEVPGQANALTHIAPLKVHGNLARYQLKPVTGQRHQLRVHMAALGLPIVNDGIYPVLTPEGADYSRPLQLLAQAIAFADPLSGQPRQFTSRRRLMDLPSIHPV